MNKLLTHKLYLRIQEIKCSLEILDINNFFENSERESLIHELEVISSAIESAKEAQEKARLKIVSTSI